MTDIDQLANQNSRANRRRGGMPTKLGIETLEPRCMLSVNVTTWHNDLTRQGLNNNETILTPANVNAGTFGKLFSYPVTGQVYAEPLYVSNLNMGALGTHNAVFVVTENNDVYAFDGVNNGAGGGQLWHVNLGTAANVADGYFGTRYNGGVYKDITPQVGITSTPYLDTTTNTMYIDSFRDDGGGNFSHHIYALDITNGSTKNTVTVAASIQGNGVDSVGGVITFNAKQELQRAAVTMLNGVLYFAYAGYADTDPFHGWILGYNASNLSLVKVFNSTPNFGTDGHEGEAGFWQSGAGLTSDGTHLYVISGNGDFDASVGNYGDTFLELTPDNSTQPTNKNGYGLSVTDNFTPYNEQTLSDNDTDLGSGGPMILPDQPGALPHLMVGVGKQGVIYLVNRDNLGGHGVSSDNVIQTVNIVHSTNSFAYFNNTLYIHGWTDVLKAYSISWDGNPSHSAKLSAAAIASGTNSYGFPGAQAVISSYGNSANGIVWEIQYSTTGSAVLRAYNAVPSGTNLLELYNSGSALGSGIKFTVPTVADGHVYVGTANSLAVFGLTSNPNTPPAAPTNLNLTASAVQGLQVQLTWTDNSNNENAFRIERSTDGTNFTPLAIASVNSTSYTDTSVVSGTTYYYRVRATNPIGDSSPASAGPVTPLFTPPVLWYHFDDGAGTFAGDSGSVGTNTGVLVGTTPPSWVAGQIGTNALQFTGTGAYNQTKQSAVQVTSNLVAPLGTTSTLTAWVKTTQTGNNTSSLAPAITGVDQAGTTSDIAWGTINASGQMGITVGTSGGAYSANPINDGQWHNIAMTRDASTGLVKIYVDGVLSSQATADAGNKGAQFYLIGALTDRNSTGYVTGANYFNGQLDDIRVYNRVLTAAEILEIGSAPSAPLNLSANPVQDSSSVLALSWTNTSGVAQNVQVERKTGVDGTYEQIARLPGTATTYFDPNLKAGTQYYYRVQASDSAGVSDYSNEANSSPPKPEVVGRFTFYNDSDWNFHNNTSYTFDALAMDTNKHALLPGETSTFANYTSFSKGINGIAVDVEGFEGLVTPDDFKLMVGNSSDPNTWQPAPPPDEVRQYPGLGVNGSVRLELKWQDPVIQNEWIQVTLKANDNTGLSDDDVFYFGNAIGDTGNSPTDAIVDATDELNVHNNYTSNASLTNIYDINRDKVVDAADELIVHNNYSGSSPLIRLTAPGGIHGAGIGLDAADVTTASGSPAGALSADPAPIEAPVATSVTVAAPTQPPTTSLVTELTSGHAKSVDKVFANHRPTLSRADFAASLLNLESSRHGRAKSSLGGGDSDHAHSTDATCNDASQIADELIASDIGRLQNGRLKSFLARF